MSGIEDHDRHGDRRGADTTHVEVCWRCAADWSAYVRRHPEEMPSVPVLLAVEPRRDFGLGGPLDGDDLGDTV